MNHSEDPRVAAIVREFQARLEAGETPDAAAVAEQHPEYAGDLQACLEGLLLVHGACGSLKETPIEAQPIGDFRIRGEIGRGGMGVVYEAEQLSLGRRVALKVLPFAAVLDQKHLRRFRNEAQAAAHLNHAHIVPVYSVGCDRGVHYYAMQHVDGMSIADMIACLRAGAPGRDEPLRAVTESDPKSLDYCRAVARLGAQAADALDHAHQEGVVHRDVKPANLLIDGEGKLWITDFGLATFRTSTGPTVSGDLVGTVRYMSPEQALAKRDVLDHRTDIYSLGITLYEVLTLTDAFPGDDAHRVIQSIVTDELAPPRRLNPAVPEELETIVLKAIAKEPADRYATAQEFADDLQRFLDDRPIRAKRPTLHKRAAQWARRHRHATWAAVAILLLGIAGLAAATVLVSREKTKAERTARWAKTNYQRSRSMIEKVVRRLGDGMAYDLELSRTQRAILRDAIGFFAPFLDEAAPDDEARRERALAHEGTGWAHHLLGEHAAAERHFDRALQQLEALRADTSDPGRYLDDLALLHERRAQLFTDMQRPDRAHDEFRAGLRHADTWRTLQPGEPAPAKRAARLHLALGLFLDGTGKDREAAAAYGHALDILRGLTHPAADYRADLAETQFRLARLWQRTGELREAEEVLTGAFDIANGLSEEYPDEPRFHWLANAIYRTGGLQWVREAKTVEFAKELPEHDAKYDKDPALKLGPEPVPFHAFTTALSVKPVRVLDLPDLPGYLYVSHGTSNVLGRYTGKVMVYTLRCKPGLKFLIHARWRTEDGDELWINTENTLGKSGTFLIVGGTGRFKGAEGSGTVQGGSHETYGVVSRKSGTIRRR